jgi:hypothetical protein
MPSHEKRETRGDKSGKCKASSLGNDAGDTDGKFQVFLAMIYKNCATEETEKPVGDFGSVILEELSENVSSYFRPDEEKT